MIKTKVAFFE